MARPDFTTESFMEMAAKELIVRVDLHKLPNGIAATMIRLGFVVDRDLKIIRYTRRENPFDLALFFKSYSPPAKQDIDSMFENAWGGISDLFKVKKPFVAVDCRSGRAVDIDVANVSVKMHLECLRAAILYNGTWDIWGDRLKSVFFKKLNTMMLQQEREIKKVFTF